MNGFLCEPVYQLLTDLSDSALSRQLSTFRKAKKPERIAQVRFWLVASATGLQVFGKKVTH